MPRPVIDLQNWATNAVYSGGPKAGTPTKVAPSVGLAEDGYQPGTSSGQPTAQELNYELNRAGQIVPYLDGIDGATIVTLGARNPNQSSVGIVYDPTQHRWYSMGSRYVAGGGDHERSIQTSFNEARSWGNDTSESGTGALGGDTFGQPGSYTGQIAVRANGDFLALAADFTHENIIVAHDSSVSGGGDASFSKTTLGASDVLTIVRHNAQSGEFIIGGISTNTAAWRVALTGPPTAITVASPTIHQMTLLACGDTWIVGMDPVSGSVWRASATTPSGGFALQGALFGANLLKNLLWLPADKTFFATTATGGVTTFWRSTDGALWSSTGTTLPFDTTGLIPSPTSYPTQDGNRPMIAAVHGTEIHMLFGGPKPGGFNGLNVVRALSRDVGASWKLYSIPAESVDTTGAPATRRFTVHCWPTDDRVYYLTSDVNVVGEHATADFHATLRLGSI